MNGYSFYELVKKENPDAIFTKLNVEEAVALFNKAKKSIRAKCGEINRLSSPEIRNALLEFLRNGGEFTTTCGKYIHGGPDKNNPVNPLLLDLQNAGYLGNKALVFYTSVDPYTQVFYGDIHAYVIDDGEYIYIEEPHGYVTFDEKNNHDGFIIEKDPELARVFGNFKTLDFNYTEIQSIEDINITQNTLWDFDERWGSDPNYVFQTKEEYYNLMAKR